MNASIGAAIAALAALAFGASALAQEKSPLYKYTDADGHVVYTDKVPPSTARNVQPKQLGTNVIETSEISLTAQIASEKYPVTLYTFKCGEVCDSAEALLNRRGVPFKTVDVSEREGAAKLAAIAGGNSAPVLQVGDTLVAKGLNEQTWQTMLDQAGYPKTPAPRRVTPGAAPSRAAADSNAKSEAPPAATAPSPAPAAPANDGGYPKT